MRQRPVRRVLGALLVASAGLLVAVPAPAQETSPPPPPPALPRGSYLLHLPGAGTVALEVDGSLRLLAVPPGPPLVLEAGGGLVVADLLLEVAP